MEARTALRGSGISRRMVAVAIAVLAAFVLGAAGGYVAKTVSLQIASAPSHIVAGQIGGSGVGSAWNYSNLRHGTQSIEGPAPSSVSSSASFREPSTGRGGPQS
jgi:hypothetical protein